MIVAYCFGGVVNHSLMLGKIEYIVDFFLLVIKNN